MMVRKEKQWSGMAAAATKMRMVSSSEDEDSDVEKNFALLTGKQKRGGTEDTDQHHREDEGGVSEEQGDGEEEEHGSDDGGEEDEDGSDDGDEEEDGDKLEGDDEEKEDKLDEEEADEDEEEDVDTSEEEDVEDEEEVDAEEGVDSDASEEDDGEDEGLEDAAGGSELQTQDSFRKELSNMSYEDIIKLQSKVGTRVYNKVAYGSSRKPQQVGNMTRLNKNRPTEISSKRPAPFLRQVVSVKKPTLRDPRFDDLSGEYRPEVFDQTYKFIHDIKLREKEMVKKQLRKMKSNQEKEKLQFLLKRMENQERARQSREQQRERELLFKQRQREQVGHGAQPFFLKKSEKKKLQLAEKYQALKKSGKLENFLSKKRKRNAGKDRRKLPRQQQDTKAVLAVH